MVTSDASFPLLTIHSAVELSGRLRANGLLLILQRSGKCLSGPSHIPCALVEANYSFGIFLLPYEMERVMVYDN